jgi:hypothetical protein
MPYSVRFLAITVCALLLSGCAEYPSGGSSSASGAILNVTMTVSGQINPNYYYFVVFNNANDPHGTNGPEPVIAPPNGNGFVAGAATSYIEYSTNQGGDGYLFYKFNGATLQSPTAVGAPSQDTPVSAGGNTIQFQIPVSELATSTVSAGATNYIQVNFIAYSRLIISPDDTSSKDFDALGDTHPGTGQLNDYFTFPTTQNNTYSDSSVGNEPTGDEEVTNGSGGYSPVSDPDVDISGWSITVTN